MSKQLIFNIEHHYPERSEGITLPVALSYGEQTIVVRAKVDTGAAHYLFRYEHAAELGIPLAQGEPIVMNALGASLEADGYYLTLQTFELTFESLVYFAKYRGLPRNLLGRIGGLRNLKLAVIDYDNMIYLNAYDE